MAGFEHIAEERIRGAIREGLFDDLPGRGRPLDLRELANVPPELRAAYGMLKDAGVLPEELGLQQHMVRLEELLAACDDEGVTRDLRRELNETRLRFDMLMERNRGAARGVRRYAGALRRRWTGA